MLLLLLLWRLLLVVVVRLSRGRGLAIALAVSRVLIVVAIVILVVVALIVALAVVLAIALLGETTSNTVTQWHLHFCDFTRQDRDDEPGCILLCCKEPADCSFLLTAGYGCIHCVSQNLRRDSYCPSDSGCNLHDCSLRMKEIFFQNKTVILFSSSVFCLNTG